MSKFYNEWNEWFDKHHRQEFAAYPSIDHTPYETAFEGECILVSLEHIFGGGYPYNSAIYKYPTWASVLEEFDKSIYQTNDHHHIFLEGIGELPQDKCPTHIYVPSGVVVLMFHTGS